MNKLINHCFKTDLPKTCPACSASVDNVNYIYRVEGVVSNFYRCSECTMLFAHPVFIPELDKRQMDGLENAELFNSKLLKKIYTNYFIRREIRALRRVKPGQNLRLLDIGCGTGWTTKVYADHQFDVVGLEPSEGRAEFARNNYDLNVVCDYVENACFNEQFDVVVLRHIIEHFAEPGVVLDKIRGFLKKDGVMLIIVPNIECLGKHLFDTDWAWVLPWHCNFFSPLSIKTFLEKHGLASQILYQTASPLYYPGAFMRRFPRCWFNRLFRWNKVLAMFLFAPLALVGKWLGQGDNINIVVKVKN